MTELERERLVNRIAQSLCWAAAPNVSKDDFRWRARVIVRDLQAVAIHGATDKRAAEAVITPVVEAFGVSVSDHLICRCHYCGFTSRDSEETFAHLFTHRTSGEAEKVSAVVPPAADGLLPAASPLAAQPDCPGQVGRWLRRHFGWIVF